MQTDKLDLNEIKKIHFVGIGGIGMSALARLFLSKDKEVSGSDMSESSLVKTLEKEGIKFFNSQRKENITTDIDLIIFTAAVPVDHAEIVEANNLNIPCFTYAEILGQVTKDFYTIAVSGTHGKTTTTAMIADVLKYTEQKPHAIIGSLIKSDDASLTNYIKGDSDYFVVEACEYKKSFLNIFPKIIAITNIEADHLDFYKDLEDIQNTFIEFVKHLPEDGYLICNTNDINLKPIIDNVKCNIVNYLDFIDQVPDMKVFGKHNIQNAAIGLAVANILELDQEQAKEGLNNFSGTWRRMEFKGQTENNNLIYDDYAHHPTEISASLKALKDKFSDKKIVLIFQPHLYSRTRELFEDFIISLSIADKIILAPIYAAREVFDKNINSQMLADKINQNNLDQAETVENFLDIKNKILELDKNSKDLIFVTMGAGDIYQVF